MPTATIMLVNPVRLSDFYFTKDAVRLATELLKANEYVEVTPIRVEMVGEAAAEEMFDLTNNPSRQDERMEKYGNGRSVSMGDIVQVDGVHFVCATLGWEKL
jgi:hypothetical protein